jgi:hypothetical protein
VSVSVLIFAVKLADTSTHLRGLKQKMIIELMKTKTPELIHSDVCPRIMTLLHVTATAHLFSPSPGC